MATAQDGQDGPGTRRARRSPAADERRRDPERTKARIVDAAIEEFSAKGFAGARVSAIARRAGVNQQLIAYYFDGKDGLYREIGRRWRAFEAAEFADDTDFAEVITKYVRLSADHRRGGRLLAWEGLADDGEDGPEGQERNARLREEAAGLRKQQRAGRLDDGFDPAALLLIGMSAGNALAVYPQLARGLFGADATSSEVVEHYAEQLARLVARAVGTGTGPAGDLT
jgi:TetR/AcrR family transcriptional regulator